MGGGICVVVKKGDTEGYVEELTGFKTKLYFANFNEDEKRNYLEANNFRATSLVTRHPYSFEIPVDRIYATGVKTARLTALLKKPRDFNRLFNIP